MRRKPTNSGYNNPRKPRYQQSGGEHRSQNSHHSGHGGARPRKNYAAAREKYLAQARDSLAAGDRVLAENYFQHADHCYRMMVEEGYYLRNSYNQPYANAEPGTEPAAAQPQAEEAPHTGQLPAFLTTMYDHEQAKPVDPVVAAQAWEERDA